MTGEEFISHCNEYTEHPTSMDGVLCVGYIQGFLAGAELTDGVVFKEFQKSGFEPGSFEDRAFKIRLTP